MKARMSALAKKVISSEREAKRLVSIAEKNGEFSFSGKRYILSDSPNRIEPKSGDRRRHGSRRFAKAS